MSPLHPAPSSCMPSLDPIDRPSATPPPYYSIHHTLLRSSCAHLISHAFPSLSPLPLFRHPPLAALSMRIRRFSALASGTLVSLCARLRRRPYCKSFSTSYPAHAPERGYCLPLYLFLDPHVQSVRHAFSSSPDPTIYAGSLFVCYVEMFRLTHAIVPRGAFAHSQHLLRRFSLQRSYPICLYCPTQPLAHFSVRLSFLAAAFATYEYFAFLLTLHLYSHRSLR